MSTSQLLLALADLSPKEKAPDRANPSDLIWMGTSVLRGSGGENTLPAMLDHRARGVGPGSVERLMSPYSVCVPEVIGIDGTPIEQPHVILGDVAAKARLAGRSSLSGSWIIAVVPDPESPSGARIAPIATAVFTIDENGVPSRIIENFPLPSMGPANGIGERYRWRVRRSATWTLALETSTPDVADRLTDSLPYTGAFGEPVARDSMLRSGPQLNEWCREVCDSQGWHFGGVTGAHPASIRDLSRGAVFCYGFALHPVPLGRAGMSGAALAAWAILSGLDRTAFGALAEPGRAPAAPEPHQWPSAEWPVPLNRAQERIVLSSRSAPITVVSGAPGTGKTHTIAAIVADSVRRGASVLIATRSIEAATVVAEHLERQPGPVPLRFGDQRALDHAFDEISRRLAGRPRGSASESALAGHRVAASAATLDTVIGRVNQLLVSLQLAEGGQRAKLQRQQLASSAPGLFDGSVPLAEVDPLLASARNTGGGWLARFRTRRAQKRLCSRLGIGRDMLDLDDLQRAVEFRRAEIEAVLPADAATELAELWPLLFDEFEAGRAAAGEELDRIVLDRLNEPGVRAALSSIASAFRSGASARRAQLTSIKPERIRSAAPVWLGTLADIENLLPALPAMFDVLVIDEASQVDIALAAPALLRAQTAVIIGDTQQLRHVSFTSDVAITESFRQRGIDHEIARLNPRRNSVLDVATSVAPVFWLDEHYRSLPHLIEFSLREFYGHRIELATRYPTTESTDCIEIVPISAQGTEVTATMRRLRDLKRAGYTDVGVITPFRSIADELTERAIKEFGLSGIERMNLMVSTVHGFQGAERQHMVVIPGITSDSSNQRRAFCERSNLFNVMVSRARTHMDVVSSLPPDDLTVLGRFLAWSHTPPPPTESTPAANSTQRDLASELDRVGYGVIANYRVGSEQIDLVVRNGDQVIGVMCGVHAAGPGAHVRRHLMLQRAGWTLYDLVPLGDGESVARTVVRVRDQLGPVDSSATATE